MVARVPNDSLRVLMREAEWSGGALARAINAVAAENGMKMAYGRASVGQWLAGASPRPPVPKFLAEAFTRRLGRAVAPDDAGFGEPRTSGGPETASNRIRSEGVVGTDWPRLSMNGVYRVTDLDVPTWSEAVGAAPVRPVDHWGAVHPGPVDVETLARMLRYFADVDSAVGAGHVRPTLVAYLVSTVNPILRAASGAALRKELLSTAAQLYYLCGFMCFDDEVHGAAQSCYRVALQLAAEAADPVRYAIALRAMSAQAHTLGQHRQAVHLAEAAAETAATRPSAHVQAFVTGQLAVANAATGNRRLAISYLRAAERHLDHATSSSATVGAYHHASLFHQRAAVAACLGDGAGAVTAMRESVRQRPATEVRSRAITLARLAELQLDSGDVEHAVTTWHRFLDAYPLVHSGRMRTAIGVLRSRLSPYRKLRSVNSLLRRANALRATYAQLA